MSESFTQPLVTRSDPSPAPVLDVGLPSLTRQELTQPSCSYYEQVTRELTAVNETTGPGKERGGLQGTLLREGLSRHSSPPDQWVTLSRCGQAWDTQRSFPLGDRWGGI